MLHSAQLLRTSLQMPWYSIVPRQSISAQNPEKTSMPLPIAKPSVPDHKMLSFSCPYQILPPIRICRSFLTSLPIIPGPWNVSQLLVADPSVRSDNSRKVVGKSITSSTSSPQQPRHNSPDQQSYTHYPSSPPQPHSFSSLNSSSAEAGCVLQ